MTGESPTTGSSQEGTGGNAPQRLLDSFLQGRSDFAAPALTNAQLLAVAQALVAMLVAFGTPLDDAGRTAIVAGSVALAAILAASDASIRRARAQHATELAKAKKQLPEPAQGDALKPIRDELAALESKPDQQGSHEPDDGADEQHDDSAEDEGDASTQ
jgi:hypothetical protein